MTPRCLPEAPYFGHDTGGERRVWEALQASLPAEAVLVHSLQLSADTRREADLVVVWPGVGTVVIEVKGGKVEHRGRQWLQNGRPMKDPVDQANTAKHELIQLLKYWGHRLAGTRIWHLVALPWTRVGDEVAGLEFDRSMVIDEGDIAAGRAAARVREVFASHGTSRPVPDADEVEDFVHQISQDLVDLPQEQWLSRVHEESVGQYMREQQLLVDGFADWTRLHVVGCAGSGKTWLALELARRKVADGHRVALLCYSRGLGRFLQREVSGWRRRPAYTGLFHDLAIHWGGPDHTGDSDSDYWENRLPRELTSLAARLRPEDRFDTVIVDEAQDFSDQWWPSLMQCLRDPERDGLFVFSDTGQRVFGRVGVAPIDQPPFRLRRNLRSTRPIAQLFGSLAEVASDPRGREGPPVRFVSCAEEVALERADDAVAALADQEQWEVGDIALLTTGSRHPVQRELVGDGSHDTYWDGFFAGDDVFYGHVRGFKGLERPVVVLAINGLPTGHEREVLYTGLSRARSLLVVVGDPEQIRRIGGDGVAKRLQEAAVWELG